MRIIAGRWKGLRLAAVGQGDRSAHLRPTTDRTRESLFNILSNIVDFDGMQVLDLFAGTGALGLEALSRGAAGCTFVDNGRAAQRLIAGNVRRTGAVNARLRPCDATRLGPGTPHDLIFLDPPYHKGLGGRAVEAVMAGGWAASGAVIVWEDGQAPEVPAALTVIQQRSYGGTVLTIMRV